MQIICAETVLLGQEAFSDLGQTHIIPDREINAAHLHSADALIVRSKTQVNEALLAGTPVKFVATATAGTDHMQTRWLTNQGITWKAAPGCNANSVAEYVCAGLLELTQKKRFSLAGKTAALIGHGHVGQAVERKLRALGVRVLKNDPPKAAQLENHDYLPLAQILPEADIVSLHTPLIQQGVWPTQTLADYRFFELLKPGAIFINTARGENMDADALHAAKQNHALSSVILDVWNPEPHIRPETIQLADISTPHIAGHSYEGKLNGTLACFHALCAFAGLSSNWDVTPYLPQNTCPSIRVDIDAHTSQEALLNSTIKRIYNIIDDDHALRHTLPEDEIQRAIYFDGLRKTYRLRREFSNTEIELTRPNEPLEHVLSELGFPICLI
jgi:erythronate-4-phosphate dehydrogenase